MAVNPSDRITRGNPFRGFPALFILLLTLLAAERAHASVSPRTAREALRMANSAVGRYVGDYTLVDQDGKRLNLSDLKGKPIVISYIYTSCGHTCPTIMMNLKGIFSKAGSDFGEKFIALTIGFDTENDTPERLRAYGSTFTDDFRKWRFVTGTRKTIADLAMDLGFFFKKKDDRFDHLNMVTIIDAKGRIYRQVYGLEFREEDILEPLAQALTTDQEGIKPQPIKPTGLIDRLALLCYTYDETTGTYVLDYTLLMSFVLGLVIQGVIVLFIGYVFFVFRRRVPR